MEPQNADELAQHVAFGGDTRRLSRFADDLDETHPDGVRETLARMFDPRTLAGGAADTTDIHLPSSWPRADEVG